MRITPIRAGMCGLRPRRPITASAAAHEADHQRAVAESVAERGAGVRPGRKADQASQVEPAGLRDRLEPREVAQWLDHDDDDPDRLARQRAHRIAKRAHGVVGHGTPVGSASSAWSAKPLPDGRAIADNSVVNLVIAPEVAAARAAGRPLVALESTLIAHGLPWPDNLAIARELEATVRAGGAVPATIAVVDGRCQVGLSGDVLERVAHDGGRFAKAGATDLAVHI